MKTQRHAAILRIIRQDMVGSQEQLQRRCTVAVGGVRSWTVDDGGPGFAKQPDIRRADLHAVNAQTAALYHAKSDEVCNR